MLSLRNPIATWSREPYLCCSGAFVALQGVLWVEGRPCSLLWWLKIRDAPSPDAPANCQQPLLMAWGQEKMTLLTNLSWDHSTPPQVKVLVLPLASLCLHRHTRVCVHIHEKTHRAIAPEGFPIVQGAWDRRFCSLTHAGTSPP